MARLPQGRLPGRPGRRLLSDPPGQGARPRRRLPAPSEKPVLRNGSPDKGSARPPPSATARSSSCRAGSGTGRPHLDARWPSDRKAAQAFFRELARKVVLLDTGVHPGIDRELKSFARFLRLPHETLPVGLEHFQLNLVRIALSWRAGARRRRRSRTAWPRAGQQMSDYARIGQLLGAVTERQDRGRRPGRRPRALPRPALARARSSSIPPSRSSGRPGARRLSRRPDRRPQRGLRLDRGPPDRLPQGRPRPGASSASSSSSRLRRPGAARPRPRPGPGAGPASPAWP
ncbi:MAG: hypothetical protein M0C28_00800 [Candidatus Moduliflexus flocculans]|nr:hypothetical protein [Candidatus Moduliflexus flocculans]